MIILYVDDDQDDVDLFRDALNSVDPAHQLISAKDGEQGLKLLARMDAPDFIFLDMNMPVKNGYETLKAIRTEDRFKDLPVVILSTAITSEAGQRYRNAGANLCLVKPVLFIDLCNSLGGILRSRA